MNSISIPLKKTYYEKKYLLPTICLMLVLFRRSIAIFLKFYLRIEHGRQLSALLAFIGILIWIINRKQIKIHKALIIPTIVLFLIVVSVITKPNSLANDYLLSFIIYCLLGAYSVLYAEDSGCFINVFCWFAIVLFVFCGPIPFITKTFSYMDMGYITNGMAYGEWILFPAFIGFHILRKRLSIKWFLIMEILVLVIIVLYANRGSLLSILFFLATFELWEKGINKKNIIKWIIIAVLAVIVFFYLEDILLFIQNKILIPNNISSRSVTRILSFFESEDKDLGALSRGRENTSEAARYLFSKHPFWGIGVGKFYYYTGHAYTHNFFSDALTTFGVLGGSWIIFLAIKSAINVFREDNKEYKLLLLILFTQCFPRLLISQTFVTDVTFWIFIMYSYRKKRER